jgi:hypothetical protein
MAKASKSSAADHVAMEGFEGHYAELGGTTVGWETYTADADLTPLFARPAGRSLPVRALGVRVRGQAGVPYGRR